jgi:catechol 2,3-dioxygenase-like lactoylglutathione lyase family enzyme
MSATGLLGFGMTVPSMSEATEFYGSFGLGTHEHDTTVAMRCAGRDLDQITLVEGPEKSMGYMAFGYEFDKLDDLKSRLKDLGLDEADPMPGVSSEGFWFRDPWGVLVNLQPGQPAPAREEPPTAINMAGNYERIDGARWHDLWVRDDKQVRPRRMGHTILFSPDIDASERFYCEVLGFKLSDKNPGLVTFLNTGPGDHHVFGFAQSTHTGLHHTSFEVADIDEIALGAQQMADKGYTTGWGLGRHTMGSNLFHYVRDPWGSWTEYFSDIDQITEAWEPREWDVPPAVWCPTIPTDFAANHEPHRAIK